MVPDEGEQVQPALSPDGRWVAYVSNEGGARDVYIRSLADPEGGKVKVSSAGGIMPVWSRSGRELFFLSSMQELVSVPIPDGPELLPGAPAVLFLAPNGIRAQSTTLA